MKKVKSIKSLPIDCLKYIITFLSNIQDVLNFTCTNKLLYNSVLSSNGWMFKDTMFDIIIDVHIKKISPIIKLFQKCRMYFNKMHFNVFDIEISDIKNIFQEFNQNCKFYCFCYKCKGTKLFYGCFWDYDSFICVNCTELLISNRLAFKSLPATWWFTLDDFMSGNITYCNFCKQKFGKSHFTKCSCNIMACNFQIRDCKDCKNLICKECSYVCKICNK